MLTKTAAFPEQGSIIFRASADDTNVRYSSIGLRVSIVYFINPIEEIKLEL
jgi:hypothetical protein